MRNNIMAILLLCIFSTAVLAAPSVKNYFSQPTSGNDNTLVISGTSTVSGTQNVTGTLNVTGYASINGYTKTTSLGTAAYANTANISLGTVTLTGLIANVTTSSITITTGNVNIPVTVNGVLLYIKANTAQ